MMGKIGNGWYGEEVEMMYVLFLFGSSGRWKEYVWNKIGVKLVLASYDEIESVWFVCGED